MAAKKPGPLYKARCKVCAKDISVGLNGIAALFFDADGTKYKEGLPKKTLNTLNLHQVFRPYWVMIREIQVKHHHQSKQQQA